MQWRLVSGHQGRRPDFLVVGAQKAGTTYLYHLLTRHPAIVPALRKEIHFFDRPVTKSDRWYRAHFPGQGRGGPGALTGEATPYYLFDPGAAAAAAALAGELRVLFVLRDPVARAYSHYHHEVAKGRETRSFEDAVYAELGVGDIDIANLHDLPAPPARAPWGDPARHRSYLARGLYARQVDRWLRAFGLDRCFAVQAEHLFDDPGEVMAGVFRFLGLPPATHTEPMPPMNRRSYEPMDEDLHRRLTRMYRDPNRELNELLDQLEKPMEW